MRALRPFLILLLLAGFVLPSVFASEQDLLEARARAAFADRDYGRGVALFGELLEKNDEADHADYWAMMIVRGCSLAGDPEQTVDAGESFIEAFPDSRYFDKVAFYIARAMLLTGRGAEGTELMARSVDRLAGPELRTAIAGYYLAAADQAFAGIAPQGPFDPGTPPDYARALKLYGLARASGIPAAQLGDVLLRYARAALETKGYDLVIDVLDERARDEQLAADPDALLLRGRALLGKGLVPAARDVFLRVADEASGTDQAAEALFLTDDPAALERLVREYPQHPRAVEGAFRLGELLKARGHVDRAVETWLAAANAYPDSAYAPRAVKAAADLLFAAERFDEARTRYDEFLRRFPENPEWSKARDQLTEAWYQYGAKLDRQDKFDEAAAVWEGLRTKYPLSVQAPRSLLAEALHRSLPKALAILRELLARYPQSPEAPRGALRIASISERMSEDAAEAVAAYRQVIALYPRTDAAREAESQLNRMQEEALSLKLPKVVPPGAPAQLEITTRNLERVEGRVYRIDPVAYFNKHGSLSGIENVMVGVMAPDAVFDHQVLSYGKYKSIDGKLSVPVEGEGAYIVVVDGGKLTATCLLLVSDLTVITKESASGVLAFVQDLTDREPIEGAEVLVRRRDGEILTERTGADGVARLPYENLGAGEGVAAVRGDSVALADFGSRKLSVRGLSTKIHIATDRPVYRPGHEVKFRAVVRQAAGEFFKTPAGEKVLIKVADRAGNPLYRQEALLSEFGTVAGAFRLPDDLPPHSYAIEVRFGDQDYRRDFHVEAYRKPQIFLTVAPKKPVYIRGEDVEIGIQARYAFGRPMAGLSVNLDIIAVGIEGWNGKRVTVTTDANGAAELTVPTRPGVDAVLRVVATARDVTRRVYYTEAEVPVTNTGYRATLSVEREGYVAGETARIKLLTADALGNPVAAEGKIEVGYHRRVAGNPGFNLVETLPVTTDESGKTFVEYPLAKHGDYRFYYRGADRSGREVNAEVTFYADSSANRLVVRVDRPEHFVGDRMQVRITAPAAPRWALLSIEGEDLYDYRVVKLAERESTFEFEVDRRQVPEVWVAAALISGGDLYRGLDKVTVMERIRVEVTAGKEKYYPGELCSLTIETKDDAGRPLPAEVAVSVVDEGLYRIRADDTPDLVAFFRPGSREHLVRTASSAGFEYRGKTRGLSADLIAERERRLAEPAQDPAVMLEEEALEEEEKYFEGPDTNSAIGIGGGAGGAFGGRGGHRNLKAMGGGGRAGGAEALFAARKRFEDTAFYRANIVTGADGTATVEFTLPDDLTEWRITARGASHGNAFGTARSSFKTDRPLVIRAALPRFLREGDTLTGGAGVVNGMDEETAVTVALAPTAGEGEIVSTVDVPAGAERLVNWPLPTGVMGEVTFLARATTKGMAEDAVERKLRVLAYGVPWRDGFGAVGTDPAERTLILPEDSVPGTVQVVILAPKNTPANLLAGIGELRRFPYGCTEQTVNRFYPALEVAKAFRELGMDRSGELVYLDRIVKAGALRLTYLQNGEGLWGWWQKGGTNPEMTAYALIGLAAARDSGVELSTDVFQRAEKALPGLIKRTADPDERAFLYLAQSRAFGADFKTLAGAFADRSRLTLKGLAFLALAYEPLGETAQHTLLRTELLGKVTKDADTESLGFALMAAAVPGDRFEELRPIETVLAERRFGAGFGTTRETGAVVAGMARVAASAPFSGSDATGPVAVMVNGRRHELARSERMVLPADLLVPGRNRVRVSGVGPYSVLLSCVRRNVPEARGSLEVSRQLALVPASGGGGDVAMLKKDAPVREPLVDAVRIGEAVRVTLTVRTGGERYLVVEDPLPAGFEAVPNTIRGPVVESTRYDDKMVFFLENPAPEVTISYIIQGEAPGAVRTPPAVAYAMYRPNASAYTGENALTIADFDEPLDRDRTLAFAASDLWTEALRAERVGDLQTAEALIEVLLERFELNEQYLIRALRTLARLNAATGDDAGVIAAYERLMAEVPSFNPEIGDEQLRAKSFAALDRDGEAMGSLERIAWQLFLIDRQVPVVIGGDRAFAIEGDLLDRYPAAEYTEHEFLRRADRAALRYEEAIEKRGEAPEELLEPLNEYLARFPESSAAPQVAFRLARARLRAGKFAELEALSRRFGDRYPHSDLCDDADWFTAYALFAQGRHDEAEQFALASLAKEYVQKDGTRGPSEYRNNLVHLMAQVAHIEGRLDEAVALYEQVKDFSVDAREALAQLTEVSFTPPAVVRVGTGEDVSFAVTSKNLSTIAYQVYPIDLLVYFTLRKDVEKVAGLNLDGLPPMLARALVYPAESMRRERVGTVSLGNLTPGVYLVILKGGEREKRTLVIVSDLSAEIRRHHDGVRILVTHRQTGEPVPGAFVKIAREGQLLSEGRTDARGVFEVRGNISGTLSAVVEMDGSYALGKE